MTTTTGRRAYVSFVDDTYFVGFVALLKSLHLSEPGTTAELVVLHDGLDPAHVARLRVLRPDVRFVRVDPAPYERYRKGDDANYLYTKAYYILDAFRLRDYDRVVTLDTDMIVAGPVEELFDHPATFAAVPQLFDSDGGRKLNSGLLVFGREHMSDEFVARLDEIGESGAYELERHDQGVLTAALDGDYTRLDRVFNWVKRATRPGDEAPADARIIHYTGRFKPWTGGEQGYAALEQTWHRFAVSDAAFLCRFVEAARAHVDAGGAVDDAFLAHCTELVRDLPAELFERLRREDLTTKALLRTAAELSAQGDFAAAVAVRRLVAVQTGRVDQPLRYATALRAVGRYDDAMAVAGLGAVDGDAVDGRYFQAETAWVRGDVKAASAHVGATLARQPVHAKARSLQRRLAWPSPDARVESTLVDGGLRLSHAAFYVDELGNFGDELLPVAVRESVAALRPVGSWTGVHVHQVFDEAAVERVNATDALLVGGGGLFLPDTMPNGNSGWQWNVPDESLRRLEVPLALTAVGYNLFDGQEIHGDRFAESLRLTVDTAALVGLRNHGSIDRVRSVLPAALAEKVVYMPCPTTFLGLLDHGPGARVRRAVDEGAAPVVYVNIAYDRSSLRFKDDYPAFLAAIDSFVRSVGGTADVRVAAHTVGDERVAHDLYAHHGTRIPVDAFFRKGVDDALQAYADAAVVVGMRGHAGMIPFGVGTPIVSLVSHPKLRYFLEDVEHPEWGLSIHEPDLAERLTELVRDVLGDQERYRGQVAEARAVLRGRYDEALGKLLALV
ncbi:glycosyltransferase [Isoptericola halotolerans]|uniref:glycosyltransferase n=1 Tax=Isoptericola halotolerans TaxID=300560 RepID=UPI00388DCEF1